MTDVYAVITKEVRYYSVDLWKVYDQSVKNIISDLKSKENFNATLHFPGASDIINIKTGLTVIVIYMIFYFIKNISIKELREVIFKKITSNKTIINLNILIIPAVNILLINILWFTEELKIKNERKREEEEVSNTNIYPGFSHYNSNFYQKKLILYYPLMCGLTLIGIFLLTDQKSIKNILPNIAINSVILSLTIMFMLSMVSTQLVNYKIITNLLIRSLIVLFTTLIFSPDMIKISLLSTVINNIRSYKCRNDNYLFKNYTKISGIKQK